MAESNQGKTSELTRRQLRQKEFKKKQARKRLLTWVCVILSVAIICGLGFFSTGAVYSMTTAAVVDGVKYSPAEFNFYYYAAFSNTYSSLQSTYGDYVSMFLSTDKALDEQTYSGDQTWADYLQEQALDNLREVTMLCKEAEAAGFTLSDEDRAELDEGMETLKSSAESYGVSVNGYLQLIYGQGMNQKIYQREMERSAIASAYSAQMNESFLPDDAAIAAEYAENPNAYDLVSYRMYYMDGSYTEEVTDEDTAEEDETTAAESTTLSEEEQAALDEETAAKEEEAMAQAKANADAFAAEVTDAASFNAQCKKYAGEEASANYDDEDYSLTENASLDTLSAYSFGEWLFDAARTEGDVTVSEAETGYYVVYFVSREDNSYNTVNVRHILIAPEVEDDATEATDEAWTAAHDEAEALYNEWLNDPTEENFITLANANSDDGDGTTGGLYENVAKNSTVTEFNDWIFDESRKTGDCELVKTEYGWHIIYFVAESEPYQTILVRNGLQSDAYNAWTTEHMEATTGELLGAAKYAGDFIG